MVNHGITQSTVKPNLIKIDEQSVWIYKNIKEVEMGEDKTIGYEYELIQYDKNEYIHLIDTQVTDTQLALAEVYELIGG